MFRTSGVVLCLKDEWFASTSNRHALASGFMEIFTREYSVLPQNVGSTASNVSVTTVQGTGRNARCIVIFDQTYGSLRLTERLYLEFDHILDRMARTVEELPGGYTRRLAGGGRDSL